jgi:hypothetical protein
VKVFKKFHPEFADFLFAGSGRGLPAEHPEAGTRLREVPLSAPKKLTKTKKIINLLLWTFFIELFSSVLIPVYHI